MAALQTHDIGFLMLPSVGLALEAAPAGSPQAARHRQVLLASAASLARRFSPRVGCIRSHGDIGARRFEVRPGAGSDPQLRHACSTCRLSAGSLSVLTSLP